MKHETWNKIAKFAPIVSLLVLIDQLSKYMVRQGGGLYVCNPDIAFGIHLPPILFWLFWAGAGAAIAYLIFARKGKDQAGQLALALILAGAAANAIDRIALGCVVDFIDFRFWPAFNLADSFISIGAVVLLVRWKKMC